MQPIQQAAPSLGSILNADQLFLVLLKNGNQHVALAESEHELPFALDAIAFAASLTEMETLVAKMKELQAAGVDLTHQGITLEK